jgi:hypothetical protein
MRNADDFLLLAGFDIQEMLNLLELSNFRSRLIFAKYFLYRFHFAIHLFKVNVVYQLFAGMAFFCLLYMRKIKLVQF